MNLSKETVPYYEVLGACLDTYLVSHGWSIDYISAATHELLLASNNMDVAGFVVAEKTWTKATYEESYRAFKDLYSKHVNEWEHCTLAFVFCPVATREEDADFLGSVENDAYFCRKYVIKADQNRDHLLRRLLRLPFIPLDDRSGSVSLARPIAAQDLLRTADVPRDIADRLVAMRSSEQSIAESCLKEMPFLLAAAKTQLLRRQEGAISLGTGKRIGTLDICDFRAYRGKHQFDFSSDVTVLYGPNGLGKTSLFDAIDFVCTGRLGRFAAQSDRGGSPEELIRHLDANGETQVGMTVVDSEKSVIVTRSMTNWQRSDVDGEGLDRKGLLQWLGCGGDSEMAERVDNLERLFRSCHLFGQDYQALLAQFRRDSQIEPDLLARMLALEDYVRGSRKANLVAGVLQQRDDELSEKRLQKAEEAKALEHRRDEILATIRDMGSPEAIQKTVGVIVQGLSTVGCDKVCISDPITTEQMREWRTVIAGASSRLRTSICNIELVEGGLSDIQSTKAALPGVLERLATVRGQVASLTGNWDACLKGIAERRQLYEVTLEVIERGQKEREGLTWLASANERVTVLDANAKHLESIILAEHAKLDEARRVSAEADRVLVEIDDGVGTTTNLMNQARTRLGVLRVVDENRGVWERWRAELVGIDKTLVELSGRSEEIAKQRTATSDQHQMAQEEAREAEKISRAISSSHARLAALLDQLTAYVKDATCPACGSDLFTRERLLAALATRMAEVPDVQRLAAEKEERLKQLAVTLGERVRVLAQEADQLGLETHAACEKRDKLSALSAAFEAQARAAGLPTDPSHLGEAVRRRVRAEEDQVKSLEARLTDLQGRRAFAQQAVYSTKQSLTTLGVSIANSESQLTQIRQEIQSIRESVQRRGLLMQPDDTTLSTNVSDLDKAVASVIQEAQETEAQLKEQQKLAGELGDSLNKVKSEQAELARQEKAMRESLTQHSEALKRCDLPSDSTLEQLKEARSRLAERLAACDAITDEINALDHMLAASAQSVELPRIAEAILSLSAEIRVLDDDRTRCGQWRKRFLEICTLLDQTRSDTVGAYTTGLGPTVSILQQRLRPVYGFGDLQIQSGEGSLRAVVSRGGRHFPPTDYFSESQKQVLMLSLFLAIALTQTWSSFAPVFMDDPVTHFDDLNAYAFVELLRGLLTGQAGVPRQFIISTCDERLYRIMRQQFAPLQSRVRYYEFKSIGAFGPVYECVTTS